MSRALFVVGCYRSGTTLLRRVLNSHPAIWIAKETQFLAFLDLRPGDWHAELPIGEIRRHFAVFQPDASILGWSRIPSADGFLASGSPRTLAALYAYVCRFEGSAGELAYWGDNTPRYVSMIPMLDEAWPDARYIHIVRDPRDVVASTLKVAFGPNTALTVAAEWVERVGAGLCAERLVGERILLVRFEDLVGSPEVVSAQLARFLGVEDAFRPNETGGDSAVVAALPHLRKVGKPLDPSVIGGYRRTLSGAQIREVERTTQPFLAPLGYALDEWRGAQNPNARLLDFALSYARSVSINVGRGLGRRLALRTWSP